MASIDTHDTHIRLTTPENIAFEYRIAGPFRRLFAYLLDIFFLVIGYVSLCLIVLLTANLFNAVIPTGDGFFTAILLVSLFGLNWFYGAVLETYWNGQTLGKRLLGLRVLTTDGQPITGLQAVLRNLLRTIDLMPVLYLPPGWVGIPLGMVGLLTTSANRRFQRFGDFAAGTMVVVEERSFFTALVQINEPEVFALAEQLPATYVVSPTMSRALSNYVGRRKYFSKGRLNEIARHLGEPLAERFELPKDTDYDTLLCALYVMAFADLRLAQQQEEEGFAAFTPSQTSSGFSPFTPGKMSAKPQNT
ncbi:Membrane protein containing RDD domain [Planctomycetales bacterium 10988]|nr:Membrane protein containing RDD domain [Planctomycetales bacterium 10988]